ncbi:MAG: metal ABC transporter ATP-binding protein [Nitrospirota bacterium]
MRPAQIQAERLAIGYHGRAILTDISLKIAAGSFWGIVGPNGSGKTTLVKTLAGILPPVDGRLDRPPGLRFGYVPQRNNLDDIFPLTVLDVVLMGRFPRIGIGRRVQQADRDLAVEYMRQVAVDHLTDRPFRLLSGGQKQRALIARALTFEPDVLVFDEPTTGMDLSGELEMMQLILDLHQRSGRTVLMITHDLNLIGNYAESLIVVHEEQVMTGAVSEIMRDETLGRIYRQNVHVHSIHGRTHVFVHGHGRHDNTGGRG